MIVTTSTAARAVAALALAAALTGCGAMTPGAGRPGPPAPSAPATVPAATSSPHGDPSAAEPLPTGSGGSPRPPLPTHVDTGSADAVSEAALTVMWTMDTTIDTSQYGATMRALPYLTDAYAAQLTHARPHSGPGAQWQTWAQHNGWTTASLESAEDAGRPSDSATTAYRQWIVTATPHGADGWTDEPVEATAFVTLTRSGSHVPWKVAAIQTQ